MSRAASSAETVPPSDEDSTTIDAVPVTIEQHVIALSHARVRRYLGVAMYIDDRYVINVDAQHPTFTPYLQTHQTFDGHGVLDP